MTDINNSPSGHRLPLLVGDVVRTADDTVILLTMQVGAVIGDSDGFLWNPENGEPDTGGKNGNPKIVEILGGALR